jgi:hypothetical protein
LKRPRRHCRYWWACRNTATRATNNSESLLLKNPCPCLALAKGFATLYCRRITALSAAHSPEGTPLRSQANHQDEKHGKGNEVGAGRSASQTKPSTQNPFDSKSLMKEEAMEVRERPTPLRTGRDRRYYATAGRSTLHQPRRPTKWSARDVLVARETAWR